MKRIEIALLVGTAFLLGGVVSWTLRPQLPPQALPPVAGAWRAKAPGSSGLAAPAAREADAPRWLDDVRNSLKSGGASDRDPKAPAGRGTSALGWSALLTVYAMGDRSAEFLGCVAEALRSGNEPSDVLQALRLFPRERRSEVLEGMLAAETGARWPVEEVAEVFADAGNRERAASTLADALALEPHRAWIEQLIALDPARASSLLAKIAADRSWSGDRLRQAGAALAAGGHGDLAISFFRTALEKTPLDRDALRALAEIAPDEALAHARKASVERPGDAAAWLLLGDAEAAAKSPERAYEAYRQAATRALSSDALLAMAKADSARAYTDALQLVGSRTDDQTLGLLARLALAADRPKDSLDTLLAARERDPSNRRWNAALVALDPARAAEAFAPAAESYRGRHRENVVGAYADALLETGNARAAFDRYREAFDLDPDGGAWQLGLARSDPVRAVPLLEARRAAVGDRADLLGALADAYAGAGRKAEARTLYERAVERGGGPAWTARMAQVDPAAALARLEAATSRDPSDEQAWGALGDCRRLLGDAAGAREAYARARELDPASLTWATRARRVTPTR